MDSNVFSFQVDDEIVKRQRKENDNFIIEYSNGSSDVNTAELKLCVLYFSSNDIYYPNNENAFRFSILEKDHYEWCNCKIKTAQKHIFLRDVNKQWYLSGINDNISTPDKLLAFLKNETNGYDIITVGSSAGGYAAILDGILLKAYRVFAFNAQLEINSLLDTEERTNPLVIRLQSSELRKLYDLTSLIKGSKDITINYFISINSPWDKKQLANIQKNGAADFMNIIRFESSHHGIPFPKMALDEVLNSTQIDLDNDGQRLNSPIRYSISKIGLLKTVSGIMFQSYRTIRKIIKRKLA